MKGGKDMSVQEEIADRFNVSAERLQCMIEEEKRREEEWQKRRPAEADRL